MSAAAPRRRCYVVGFDSWITHETVLFAGSEQEAIAKAKAIYGMNGLAGFSIGDSGEEPWHARCLDREIQS